MTVRAVIFDFDGVIADSEPLHYEALRQSLKSCNVDFTKEAYYDKYLGYSDYECVQAVSSDYQVALELEQIDEIIQRKTELFDELAKKQNSIIPGVSEFIDMLQQNHVPMAVCSGAFLSDIELMLAGTGLAEVFETIVAADDTTRGKPEPQGYLLTLDRLNQGRVKPLLPSQCVVIEDSMWGLQAAAAAGIHTVGVTNTYSYGELAKLAEIITPKLSSLAMDELNRLCWD